MVTQLTTVMSIVFGALGILVVVYICILGFRISAASDEGKRNTWKQRMVKAVVSMFLVIILVSVFVTLDYKLNTLDRDEMDGGMGGWEIILGGGMASSGYTVKGMDTTYKITVEHNGQPITNVESYKISDVTGPGEATLPESYPKGDHVKVTGESGMFTITAVADGKDIVTKTFTILDGNYVLRFYKADDALLKHEIGANSLQTNIEYALTIYKDDILQGNDKYTKPLVTPTAQVTVTRRSAQDIFNASKAGVYKLFVTLVNNVEVIKDAPVKVSANYAKVFDSPVANAQCTSMFGPRNNSGESKGHSGVDLIGNNTILSAAKGKIVEMGYGTPGLQTNGYGNYIIMEHEIKDTAGKSCKIYTFYAHLAAPLSGGQDGVDKFGISNSWKYGNKTNGIVTVNDIVEAGVQIAVMGGTGSPMDEKDINESTPPNKKSGREAYSTHLHFEVRINDKFGTRLNPLDMVKVSYTEYSKCGSEYYYVNNGTSISFRVDYTRNIQFAPIEGITYASQSKNGYSEIPMPSPNNSGQIFECT